MGLEEKIWRKRETAVARGETTGPELLQAVERSTILRVLTRIDKNSPDLVDVVFALLDDREPSWFPSAAKEGLFFCDGASTAHIGCHVGILQRGTGKIDREGRDYWIRPLREVGAVEPVTWMPKLRTFVIGHVISKSPYSSYRLVPSFFDLLLLPEGNLDNRIGDWIAADAVRGRLELQAEQAKRARDAADTKHSDLIRDSCEVYARNFLPSFEVLYVDDGDGDRISATARRRLADAGVELSLDGGMPDVLLFDPTGNRFWVIEAVTSDGEVDLHKVEQMLRVLRRNRPTSDIGFTTAYRTWREAAQRQGRVKNLAPDSFMWILEDPSREFAVRSYDPEKRR